MADRSRGRFCWRTAFRRGTPYHPALTPPTNPTRLVLPRLAAAWCRADLPGKTTVARRLARVDQDAYWAGAPTVDIRDRWGRHTLRLEPREYFQRWAWLLGRYHEWPLQLLLQHALRPGDTFIDVGANFGLVTLRAAALVGPSGRVVAFEPNPDVFKRLAWHVESNGLRQVICEPVALGRKRGTATLRLASANTGAASLVDFPWARDAAITHDCPVVRGDSRLTGLPPASASPLFIKIDVEGFECEALGGLSRTINAHLPAVACEVNRRCLRAAGAGLRRIRRIMERRGYQPFLFEASRGLVRLSRLTITPMQRPPQGLFDVLFLHPAGVHLRRLAPFITGSAGTEPAPPPPRSAPASTLEFKPAMSHTGA